MNRNITDSTKMLCCLMVFFHHFYLGNPWVSTLGRTACCVFFFLSAYGITKSLNKKSVGIILFLKRRLSKIYIPLLIVNAITLIAYMSFHGAGNIPIFSVFCNQITTVQADSLSILYLFDIKQMDSVTWFIDVLLIGYLFVWSLSNIPSRNKRVAAAISGYSALMCLPAIITPPHSWYLIDTLGFMAGILYAEYDEKFSSMDANRLVKLLLIFVFVFLAFSGMGIELKGLILGRYMRLITIVYSLSACAIVTIVGRRQFKESRICKLLGALSFFVYLTHVKIANTLNAIGVTNVAIAFVGVILCSIILYVIYSNLFSKYENRKS